MKKVLILVVTILVLLQLSFNVSALPKIVVERTDPQPVEPGGDLSIDVRLDNSGLSEARISTKLKYNFPFIFKSTSNDLSDITICQGCERSTTYFLLVDPSAVSGDYNISLEVSSGNSATKENFVIKVRGKPNLIFSSGSEGLERVVPNSKFPVQLDIRNIGSGKARQIRIEPDSDDFTVIGSSIQTLDSLELGATKNINFDFIASTSLTANSYVIPFKITYLDDRGTELNNTYNLGVKVINKGEISVQTIKIASDSGGTSIVAGKSFTVVARLENTGEGSANKLSADIVCPFNGPKKAFIGQLKKDEDGPAVFNFVSPEPGTFECDLSVYYEDDTGSHQFTEKFTVTVSPADYTGTIVPIVIVVLVLLFIFRKRILKRG